MAREIERAERLADLRQRRETIVQAVAGRQPEALRVMGYHLALAAHQPVVHLLAGLINLAGARRLRIAKRHDRQRKPCLAIDRQGAGDRNKRQIQRVGDDPARGFHLIDNQAVHAKARQRLGQLPAQHIGGTRQIVNQAQDGRATRVRRQA